MEDPKEKLQAEAAALGIDVDGRWGEARLTQEIEAARTREAEKDEEGEAYGDGADDASEHSGEDDAGAEEGDEPTDDRAGDAGGDDTGEAGGRDEVGSVGHEEGQEIDAAQIEGDAARDGDRAAEDRDGEGSASPADVANEPRHEGVADHGDGSADGVAPDPFDTLPPDPAELDEAAMREAYITARLAMTGPMVAAFNAACAVAGGSGGPAWFAGEADVGSYVPALVNHAVPFVRQWPTAPTEALYEHVRRAAPQLRHEALFDDLPLQHRIAWDVFRTVMNQVDEAIDQETRRRAAEEAAEAGTAWGRHDVDPDDTMFAPATSREQRSELGRARDRAGARA